MPSCRSPRAGTGHGLNDDDDDDDGDDDDNGDAGNGEAQVNGVEDNDSKAHCVHS